jgi:hypothetical protein
MEWLPGLKGTRKRGGTALHVLWMHTFHPSHATLLFFRSATKLQPTSVEVLALAIRTKPPHHLLCRISDTLEVVAIVRNC